MVAAMLWGWKDHLRLYENLHPKMFSMFSFIPKSYWLCFFSNENSMDVYILAMVDTILLQAKYKWKANITPAGITIVIGRTMKSLMSLL